MNGNISQFPCHMTLDNTHKLSPLRNEDILQGTGRVPCIYNLGTTWRWVVSTNPLKSQQGPMDRVSGWLNKFGHNMEE